MHGVHRAPNAWAWCWPAAAQRGGWRHAPRSVECRCCPRRAQLRPTPGPWPPAPLVSTVSAQPVAYIRGHPAQIVLRLVQGGGVDVVDERAGQRLGNAPRVVLGGWYVAELLLDLACVRAHNLVHRLLPRLGCTVVSHDTRGRAGKRDGGATSSSLSASCCDICVRLVLRAGASWLAAADESSSVAT